MEPYGPKDPSYIFRGLLVYAMSPYSQKSCVGSKSDPYLISFYN